MYIYCRKQKIVEGNALTRCGGELACNGTWGQLGRPSE
jgi:hypothetical protein